MNILEQKISQTDMEAAGVVSLPDVLTGSAQENKLMFDRMVRELVSRRFNTVLELLSSAAGAEQIGAAVKDIEGRTVQAVLNGLKKDIDTITLQGGSVSSVFGRAGNVVARAGDYTPQQVGATPAIHTAVVTLGTGWQQENDCWVQPFAHSLVGENTQVDLWAGAETLKKLKRAGTMALYVENNGGTARVVAMGKCPVEELQIQADFVEVISL